MGSKGFKALLLLSIVNASCGETSGLGTCQQAIGNICYEQLSGSIGSGSGEIKVSDELTAVESATNFAFTLSFDNEDASFTLISFADNSGDNGVAVMVRLNNNKVEWKKEAANTWLAIDALNNINPQEEFSLSLDIHNDSSQALVIAWEGTGAPINTSEDADTEAKGIGTNSFILFNDVSFISIEQNSAKI